MRVALCQLNASDDPVANLPRTVAMVRDAARDGAAFVLTPEVTNCVSTNRGHQQDVLALEQDDATLATLRAEAKALGLWLLIGSLALKTGDDDGRFANRSFLIDPSGGIVARYDKIHMFDVTVSETETYRESSGYRPGDHAVLATALGAQLGMTICYDVRFPALYQTLARAGAQVLTVPSAFSPATGPAHWEPLLRARAIETGCFVLAPAQTGTHASRSHRTRDTYGHSMIVSPWGEVILDAGTAPGVYCADLAMESVTQARNKIPSLANARSFDGP
ncbi:carbon-nitrogen hydrolase family protein [Sulfitobacter sabulilitoris]|uniref:Carbon-nitrogen hydrolase family protein n=1 Tax=Sulfitobacter sabulilitoris TaxID=2562655 RepID=A0A5S3PF03_9RHOB|nr:carbon-nitrogen hydrolase family protein [Sulfitobacter sabulilitoris]TMM52634.1 carbon-nitrogen hydrolase family protein [Sulfitobacter sabulilitoris]